jgi:hypothetical protein
MKYEARWRYNDLDGVHEISEEQILLTYYPYWVTQMMQLRRFDLISPEHCVDDWATVHWAWRADEERALQD